MQRPAVATVLSSHSQALPEYSNRFPGNFAVWNVMINLQTPVIQMGRLLKLAELKTLLRIGKTAIRQLLRYLPPGSNCAGETSYCGLFLTGCRASLTIRSNRRKGSRSSMWLVAVSMRRSVGLWANLGLQNSIFQAATWVWVLKSGC
jgi:hypothetical protein